MCWHLFQKAGVCLKTLYLQSIRNLWDWSLSSCVSNRNDLERHSHNTLTSSFQSVSTSIRTSKRPERQNAHRGHVAGCTSHPKHVTYMRPQEQSTFQPQDLTVCSPAGSSSSNTLGSDGSCSCQSDAANSCSDTHFSIRLHRSFQQPQWEPCQSEKVLDTITYLGLWRTFFTHTVETLS